MSTRTHQWWKSWMCYLMMQLPQVHFIFNSMLCCSLVHGRVKKLSLVQAHTLSVHFSWETVLFCVMGYYNHWAWKAMCDSSFPTPYPLPQPELSHSQGSRNTECKHFFPTRGNAMLVTTETSLSSAVFYFTLLGDEMSRNGMATLNQDFKFSAYSAVFCNYDLGFIHLVLL